MSDALQKLKEELAKTREAYQNTEALLADHPVHKMVTEFAEALRTETIGIQQRNETYEEALSDNRGLGDFFVSHVKFQQQPVVSVVFSLANRNQWFNHEADCFESLDTLTAQLVGAYKNILFQLSQLRGEE